MKLASWNRMSLAFGAGICLAVALSAGAQVQTTTTTTSGQPTREVKVERGVVVLVEGNDLFVKMDDGSIRHIPNIPESARITVDGRQLGIHDLKPGMTLQKTVTVTTTPQTVTTVQTVTGKVFYVNPPLSVILTLEDGTNQSFKIPSGQKFIVNGTETDAFGLRKGMTVTATKIVEEPVTVAQRQQQVTGKMPPPPQAPPADAPVLIAKAVPTPAPAPADEAAPAHLPKTGSELPVVGLLGFLFVSTSFVIRLIRR